MPRVQITLTNKQLEWVDAMASEEARRDGANPERYRSTFIGRLIADEHTRWQHRGWRKQRVKKAEREDE